jgi:predicted RNA-binding Zn ribbon-like protein
MVDVGSFEFFGGAACLDFANTLDGRATAQPKEFLRSYADLVAWGRRAGLIEPGPPLPDDEGALRIALELREAIFQVFVAIARDEPIPVAALDEVQARYAEAMAAARLSPADLTWRFDTGDPDRAWWPVAVDAVRLLTTGPLDRIKTCAAETGCIGLFVDTSKNHSRRWCTNGCNIDAKVQRQSRRRAERKINP